MRLVANYPWQQQPQQRCGYLAQELGLAGPAEPGRTYAVGQLMPRACSGSGLPHTLLLLLLRLAGAVYGCLL